MRTQNKRTVLTTTFHTLIHNGWLFAVLLFVSAGVIVSSLVPPQILKRIVDGYLSSSAAKSIIVPAIFYFLSQLLISFFTLAKETLLAVAGQKITKQLRQDMLAKLNALPALYFSDNPSGTTTSLFMGDVDAVQSLFTNGIISLFIDLCKIIAIVVSVWFFSPKFGLLFLIVLPVIFLLTRFFKSKMFSAQVKSRGLLSIVANYIPESLRAAEMISSFHAESFMESRYNNLIDGTYREQEHINLYDSIFSPIIQILRAITIALIALFAAQKTGAVVAGSITVGMAAAAIDYVSSVFKPVESLGMEIQNIQSALAGVKRINDFFTLEDKPSQKTMDHEITKRTARIVFDHVSFSYPRSEEKVLNDISLVIECGEHVTIKGRTGAGKSTFLNLILGLLKCTKGSVKIDSFDAESIPDSEKRHLFGYVEQTFHFVPGLVRDQITLGDKTITDDMIQRSLKIANLDRTVNSLEKGLDTPADPRLFSQGQLQLLSIARAVVCNPPILLLDEITANLDSTTERQIIKALEKAGKGRTQLCISHRLGSVLESDRIITVSEGKIF